MVRRIWSPIAFGATTTNVPWKNSKESQRIIKIASSIQSSIKHVASSILIMVRPGSKAQVALDHDGSVRLLRFVHVVPSTHTPCSPQLSTRKGAATVFYPGCWKPVVTDIVEPALPSRQDAGKLISKTSNLIVRTWTKPEKGVTLSTAAMPKLPPLCDWRPAQGEAMPILPKTGVQLDQRRARHVKQAVADQLQMLANVPAAQSAKSKSHANAVPVDAFMHVDGLENHATALFCKAGQTVPINQLLARIYIALAPVSAIGAAITVPGKTVMSCTHHLLIVEHLAHVTEGDVERALAAFDALRQGSFLSFSAHTQPAGPSAEAQSDALGVAAQLASTSTEFAALLRVMKPTLKAPQRDGVKRLLEAVAHIGHEQGRRASLCEYLELARAGEATLAQTVLSVEAAALQRGDHTYADLSAAEKAAVFAWRNGFRQSGAGSDLAKVQGRLSKMIKYVERAGHLQDLRNVGFDRSKPLASARKVVDAKIRMAAQRLNQALGRKKSPLAVLASLGINNAGLKNPLDDLLILHSSTETAINLLHAQLSEEIAQAPWQDWQRQLCDKHGQLPAVLEHHAILAYWRSLLKTQTPLGHKLDRSAIAHIAATMATEFDVAAALPVITGKLKHWIGRELNVNHLQDWAAAHHAVLAQPTPAAATEASTASIETELGHALRLAHDISTSSCMPKDLSPDGLHQFIRTYLQEHNIGNPVTLSNGSVIGLSAAPLSLSIKHIVAAIQMIAPVAATPTVDARLSRARGAVINFGSTTHGLEMFVGTQVETSAALGAGIGIGTHPFFKYVGAQAWAGAAASFGVDHVNTRGVMVRAVRRENEDGSGLDTEQARAEMTAFTDLLFAIAKGEHGDLQADAVWQKIAVQFFESKSFSIGWHVQQALTPHLVGTAGVSLRAGAGSDSAHGASTGVSLSRSADFMPRGQNARKEQSGAQRLVRNTRFARTQQVYTIGAVGAGTSVPVHTVGVNTESLSLPQLSEVLNFQISDKGSGATLRTLLENGQLSTLFTFRDMEERDASKFISILGQPSCYAQYLQVFNARFGALHGKHKLDEFIARTKNWAGPGQQYVMRYQIRDDVRRKVDEFIAVANAIHKHNAYNPLLANIANAISYLLRDEASWVPHAIMALEAKMARDALGINYGLQLAAQDLALSNRELHFVAVPLPVSTAWSTAPQIDPANDPTPPMPWSTLPEEDARPAGGIPLSKAAGILLHLKSN